MEEPRTAGDLNADTAPLDPGRWLEFLQQLNPSVIETPAGTPRFAFTGRH